MWLLVVLAMSLPGMIMVGPALHLLGALDLVDNAWDINCQIKVSSSVQRIVLYSRIIRE